MKLTRRISVAAMLALVTALVTSSAAAAEEGPGVSPNEPLAVAEQTGESAAAGSADTADSIESLRFPSETGSEETTRTTTSLPYGEMARLALSLGAVLALVIAVAWAFKRYAPRTSGMFSSDQLSIVARTYLGPRQTICLVKAPGKLLVVGATQQTVSPLSEITDPQEIERVMAEMSKRAPGSASDTFRKLVGSLSGAETVESEDGDDELNEKVNNVTNRMAQLSSKLEAYEKDLS